MSDISEYALHPAPAGTFRLVVHIPEGTGINFIVKVAPVFFLPVDDEGNVMHSSGYSYRPEGYRGYCNEIVFPGGNTLNECQETGHLKALIKDIAEMAWEHGYMEAQEDLKPSEDDLV